MRLKGVGLLLAMIVGVGGAYVGTTRMLAAREARTERERLALIRGSRSWVVTVCPTVGPLPCLPPLELPPNGGVASPYLFGGECGGSITITERAPE